MYPINSKLSEKEVGEIFVAYVSRYWLYLTRHYKKDLIGKKLTGLETRMKKESRVT